MDQLTNVLYLEEMFWWIWIGKRKYSKKSNSKVKEWEDFVEVEIKFGDYPKKISNKY